MGGTNTFRGVFRPRDLFFQKAGQILGLDNKKYLKKLSFVLRFPHGNSHVPPRPMDRGFGVGSHMNGLF